MATTSLKFPLRVSAPATLQATILEVLDCQRSIKLRTVVQRVRRIQRPAGIPIATESAINTALRQLAHNVFVESDGFHYRLTGKVRIGGDA